MKHRGRTRRHTSSSNGTSTSYDDESKNHSFFSQQSCAKLASILLILTICNGVIFSAWFFYFNSQTETTSPTVHEKIRSLPSRTTKSVLDILSTDSDKKTSSIDSSKKTEPTEKPKTTTKKKKKNKKSKTKPSSFFPWKALSSHLPSELSFEKDGFMLLHDIVSSPDEHEFPLQSTLLSVSLSNNRLVMYWCPIIVHGQGNNVLHYWFARSLAFWLNFEFVQVYPIKLESGRKANEKIFDRMGTSKKIKKYLEKHVLKTCLDWDEEEFYRDWLGSNIDVKGRLKYWLPRYHNGTVHDVVAKAMVNGDGDVNEMTKLLLTVDKLKWFFWQSMVLRKPEKGDKVDFDAGNLVHFTNYRRHSRQFKEDMRWPWYQTHTSILYMHPMFRKHVVSHGMTSAFLKLEKYMTKKKKLKKKKKLFDKVRKSMPYLLPDAKASAAKSSADLVIHYRCGDLMTIDERYAGMLTMEFYRRAIRDHIFGKGNTAQKVTKKMKKTAFVLFSILDSQKKFTDDENTPFIRTFNLKHHEMCREFFNEIKDDGFKKVLGEEFGYDVTFVTDATTSEDAYRLSVAPYVICSVSTFCTHAIVGNVKAKVIVQPSWNVAKNYRTFMKIQEQTGGDKGNIVYVQTDGDTYLTCHERHKWKWTPQQVGQFVNGKLAAGKRSEETTDDSDDDVEEQATNPVPAAPAPKVEQPAEPKATVPPAADAATSEKNPKCRVLVATKPDKFAGFTTVLFMWPINYLLLAENVGMELWINYTSEENKYFYEPELGPNTWEYYLEPINPFINSTCTEKNSVIEYASTEKMGFWVQIHWFVPWAVRAWVYGPTAEALVPDGRTTYNATWYHENRARGNRVVEQYFRYRPEITKEVNLFWNKYVLRGENNPNLRILGVHMRGSDKASDRRLVHPFEYLPYIKSWVSYHKIDNVRFFVATDDTKYLKKLKKLWKKVQKKHLYEDEKYNFENMFVFQSGVTRSDTDLAVFRLPNKMDRYRLGKEVLMDILLMSKSHCLIHSASAVAEAVFWNNVKLHDCSVHLEYLKNRNVPEWAKAADEEAKKIKVEVVRPKNQLE